MSWLIDGIQPSSCQTSQSGPNHSVKKQNKVIHPTSAGHHHSYRAIQTREEYHILLLLSFLSRNTQFGHSSVSISPTHSFEHQLLWQRLVRQITTQRTSYFPNTQLSDWGNYDTVVSSSWILLFVSCSSPYHQYVDCFGTSLCLWCGIPIGWMHEQSTRNDW